jgi:hypothetical protein
MNNEIKIVENYRDNEILRNEDYESITMWHIINTYSNNLYYLKEEDAVFIKTENENTLHIREIIYRKPFNVQLAISKVIESFKIKSVRYYFPPDQLNYNYNRIINSDSFLFVMGDAEIDNLQFKFPETAQT